MSLCDFLYSEPYPDEYMGEGFLKGGPETAPDSGVFVLSDPASRWVYLHADNSNALLAKALSDSDGSFRFDYLNPVKAYFALSKDHVGTYNHVVAGPLSPVLVYAAGTPTAGQVITLPVAPITWAIVVDATEKELTVTTHYTVNLASATVTFADPLSLTGFTAPYRVYYSVPAVP